MDMRRDRHVATETDIYNEGLAAGLANEPPVAPEIYPHLSNDRDMKSCPFCGGPGVISPDPANKHRAAVLYRPQCDRCGANMGGFDNSDFAIAAWNRRIGL